MSTETDSSAVSDHDAPPQPPARGALVQRDKSQGAPVVTSPSLTLSEDPERSSSPYGPAKHASEHHEDFGDHAEEHPDTKGAYRSPKSKKEAPHASEHHEDFEDHAEPHEDVAGGYSSPKGYKKALHVSDTPGFEAQFSHNGKGGYSSKDGSTTKVSRVPSRKR